MNLRLTRSAQRVLRMIASPLLSGVRRAVWVCALCALGCLAAFAQQDTGGLVVSVRDPNGALVPGAKVVVTNVDTNQTVEGVTTPTTGHLIVSPLRPGRYQASVEKEGFKTAISEAVSVGAQQIPQVVIKLELGSVTQSVNVTAAATVLQTVDSSKNVVLSGALKNDLPISDRNYNQLSLLTVGVTEATPVAGRAFAGAAFSAAGIKTTQTRYQLDGVDNTNYNQNEQDGRNFMVIPDPDSIAEFTVQTNSYSAEFGGGGGASVTVITKGGGNQLHGSAYEYRQGSDVNANDFFNNAKGRPISPYRYDQYGGTLGGPIYLPKVYDGRNRSFFFVDYERLPWRTNGGQATAVLPTASMVAGNFSGLGVPIYDPATGLEYPNDTIPGPAASCPSGWTTCTKMSAISQKIAGAIPAPNTAGATNYYKPGGVPNRISEYRFAVRGDQKIGAHDQSFFRYQRSYLTQPSISVFTGTILSTDSNLIQNGNGFVFNETHTFSPGLVNVARYGQTREDRNTLNSLAGQNINSQVGINGIPIQAGETGGLAGITFASGGLSQLGGAGVGRSISGVHEASDVATWAHGRHLMKIGYDYRRIQFRSDSGGLSPNGQFFFDGHYTALGTSKGQPFADFLLDRPYAVRISNLLSNDYRRRGHAAFFQDSFQVSSRFTANLGLRWEYVTPVFWPGGVGSALNVFTRVLQLPNYQGPLPASINRQVAAGIFSLNRNADKYYNQPVHPWNFGPRIGLAYKLGDRTVLRAGYALFFGAEDIGLWAQPSVGFSVPSQIESNYSPVNSLPTSINPVTFATGMPSGALSLDNATASTIFALDPVMPVPYYNNWNATIQRQLPHNVSAELSYVGSTGTNIYGQMDYNAPTPSPNPVTNYAARQLFPAVDTSGNLIPGGQVQMQMAGLMSHYHGMGIQIQKRAGNVNFLTSYTWSHEIDNWCASGNSYGNNGRPFVPFKPYVIHNYLNKANGDLDVRHRWVSAFVLNAPFGRGQRWGSNVNRVVNQVIAGWQVSGILTFESGQWFTVNENFDTQNINGRTFCGNCRQRPDFVAGQNPNSGPRKVSPTDNTVKWWNISAFQPAGPGLEGNEGRNTMLGDGLFNLNGAISKDFPIRESVRLKFRTEFYNLTNTPSFLPSFAPGSTSPSSLYLLNVSDAAKLNSVFGTMQADRGARVVQFSLRLDF